MRNSPHQLALFAWTRDVWAKHGECPTMPTVRVQEKIDCSQEQHNQTNGSSANHSKSSEEMIHPKEHSYLWPLRTSQRHRPSLRNVVAVDWQALTCQFPLGREDVGEVNLSYMWLEDIETPHKRRYIMKSLETTSITNMTTVVEEN